MNWARGTAADLDFDHANGLEDCWRALLGRHECQSVRVL
jgi:hypothetical protein